MGSLGRIANLTEYGRTPALAVSILAVTLTAFADYVIKPNLSLGFLYILPILFSAGFMRPWQIAITAAVCTLLRERLGPFSNDEFMWTREAFVFFSFWCAGLLTREAITGRMRSEEYSKRLEEEIERRRDAEEQMRVLVESTPAAIFTVDAEGCILLANRSAGRLLGMAHDKLMGSRLADFLPDLGRVPVLSERRFFRTNMECVGRRADGSLLSADVWFSTYNTSVGKRLTAIVLDSTEETREREGLGLDTLLDTSRVLVGAVLHEIRNLSAAASVACENLRLSRTWVDNEDVRALGALVAGLEKVASSELAPLSGRQNASADLDAVLRDFQLVVEPTILEDNAQLVLDVEPNLKVRIEPHSLLQLLMNLFRNSMRALKKAPERSIRISARLEAQDVAIHFEDSGTGVQRPELLFQAFRSSSDAAGLGLYVSRAIVRSFGGDLEYRPVEVGALFVIRLAQSGRPKGEWNEGVGAKSDWGLDHRRSQPVPSGTGSVA